MNCDKYRLQIDAYADGALSPAEREAFEEHRATCTECQQLADQAQQLDDLLRTELPRLATLTPAEQVNLRESVLRRLGVREEPLGARSIIV